MRVHPYSGYYAAIKLKRKNAYRHAYLSNIFLSEKDMAQNSITLLFHQKYIYRHTHTHARMHVLKSITLKGHITKY